MLLRLERLLGIRPSVETIIKIMKVIKLLKQGVSLREVICNVGLGRKSFHRHVPLIYLNEPGLLIPILKHFLNQYTHNGFQYLNSNPGDS